MAPTSGKAVRKLSSPREEAVSKRVKTDPAADLPQQDEVTVNGMVLPADWPRPGVAIDLSVHDLPHSTSDTEWWYVNGHCRARSTGREYSFFASFFRIVHGWDRERQQLTYTHALTWAIVDPQERKYYSDPVIDPSSPEAIRKQLDSGDFVLDHRLRRAFHEVVAKGAVTLPDRMFREARVEQDRLSVALDDNTFVKDEDGNYLVHCECPDKGVAMTVKVTPRKAPVRHGHDGVVKIGRKGDDMFYYFVPRNSVVGTLTVPGPDGRPQEVEVDGEAWYDHEFGGTIRVVREPPASESSSPVSSPGAAPSSSSSTSAPSSSSSSPVLKACSDDDAVMVHGVLGAHRNPEPACEQQQQQQQPPKEKMDFAWNWLAVQLEDGTDLTATTVCDVEQGASGSAPRVLDNFVLVIDADGKRHEYTDENSEGGVHLRPLKKFTSIRTTCDFATQWHLSVPSAGIDLQVRASFEEQEMVTLICKPSFWEGRMEVTGTMAGRPVRGMAFVEQHGFQDSSSLDRFFKKISKQVQAEIVKVLPLEPTRNDVLHLMADDASEHYMEGADMRVFVDTVIRPIREIVDRGGKSWRSYGLLLCIDCVGGDSERYRHWLAMPEIMHVGSLIIDDIQDRSETRRGGPTAHKMFGEAVAINAGTAAYFLALSNLLRRTPGLADSTQLRIYNTYFLTLRAGHTGQAFDINGLDYLMEDAVRTGDNRRLLATVICTHRLKSANPAGNLARIGAIVGGGSDEQVSALGMYFESIGIAFQVIDDVLNLRGFAGKGKDRGEDIREGKVTYPVAVAMGTDRLSHDQRRSLWDTVRSKPQDQAVVEEVINQIETCGALDEAVRHATEMVEEAWSIVDAAIPDSFYKLNLRAFGWYVLERHY